jgi:hypothetical protein
LWKARRLVRYDLFGWMFIAQIALFMAMTFSSGWRPQLRYIMLYFVNLLPYAAVGWVQLMQRFPKRPVLTGLMVCTVLMQSAGWWVGRNDRRPLGWLPIQILAAPQVALDRWLPTIKTSQNLHASITSLAPGNRDDPWSLIHSALVNYVDLDRLNPLEIYMPEEPKLQKGQLDARVTGADIVLLDPEAIYYKTVLAALRHSQPARQKVVIHHHIIAFVKPQFLKSQGWQHVK